MTFLKIKVTELHMIPDALGASLLSVVENGRYHRYTVTARGLRAKFAVTAVTTVTDGGCKSRSEGRK